MRIAILGAGFAGLSVAWHVLHYTKGSVSIDLFDPLPIGGGTSGISSGLLHGFSGKSAKLSWHARKGMKEAHRLITEASRALNSPVVISKGILRPALFDEQIENFKKTSIENQDETEWWDGEKCLKSIPGLILPATGGGLFIKNGLSLDAYTYLQGLWKSVTVLGTQFYQVPRLSLHELKKYDRVAVTMGPLTTQFPGLKSLPISVVKGQSLELSWPSDLVPLTYSLISQKYLIMSPNRQSCFVGATYEHDFKTPDPQQEEAKKEILPQVIKFFPPLKDAEVKGVKVGFRASSPSHLPIGGKLNEQVYFLTGFGSKGILYHGWLGKRMARALLTGDPEHFPKEIFHQIESPPPITDTPPSKN